jgi:hypothetical protein
LVISESLDQDSNIQKVIQAVVDDIRMVVVRFKVGSDDNFLKHLLHHVVANLPVSAVIKRGPGDRIPNVVELPVNAAHASISSLKRVLFRIPLNPRSTLVLKKVLQTLSLLDLSQPKVVSEVNLISYDIFWKLVVHRCQLAKRLSVAPVKGGSTVGNGSFLAPVHLIQNSVVVLERWLTYEARFR